MNTLLLYPGREKSLSRALAHIEYPCHNITMYFCLRACSHIIDLKAQMLSNAAQQHKRYRFTQHYEGGATNAENRNDNNHAC